MLSDQDKGRIFEEETYRREIRQQLDAADGKRTRWKAVWGFVNSSVFIWFASSVVLGGVSFLYSNWKKAADTERENQRTVNRLDAEITNRLVFVEHVMEMRGKERDFYDLSQVVTALEQPSQVNTFSVNAFPEYSNRNIRSLLWELMQVVPDSEKQDIRGAYQESLQLEVVAMKNNYGLNFRSREAITTPQSQALYDSDVGLRKFCCASDLERWGNPFSKLAGLGFCPVSPQK